MTDYRAAPIEPRMKVLLAFAAKMARDASQISPDDIDQIRSAGFSDRAILDAAHVTGFFSYMNRVVQALGVDTKGSDLALGKEPQCLVSENVSTARPTGREYAA